MSSNGNSRDSDPSAKVYVGDLGSGGSKPDLEREFEKFGPLKSVWVARNPPGFAFVQFEDRRDAEDSVRELDGKKVCGAHIRVEIAKSRNGPRGDRFRDRGDRGGHDNSRYRPQSSDGGDRREWRDKRDRSRDRSPRGSGRGGYKRSQSPQYGHGDY